MKAQAAVDAELLDVSRLTQELKLAGLGHQHYQTIDSTNDEARRLATGGSLERPLLLTTDVQTAGRGRGNNRWFAGRGSLAFSLLAHPTRWGVPPLGRAPVSLAVGVGLADALTACLAGQADLPIVGLHWPNDLFVNGRKLGGVLIEWLPGGELIIGVGLNINNRTVDAPPEVAARALSLCELTDERYDLTAVLLKLISRLESCLHRLGAEDVALLKRFDELCLQKGTMLRVNNGRQIVQGLCQGIAPDGGLVLVTSIGVQTIYSGTLVH